jgi:2-polyprenyl-3-methyl-5-hydroxy-6-metoxy-1,4-benzoquinol methylase
MKDLHLNQPSVTSAGVTALPSLNCPLCAQSSRRLFIRHGYWLRSCRACGHYFAEVEATSSHVQQVYGNDYFFGGGAGYPNYLQEASILRQHGRRYGQILARYMTPGQVLDVGAAAGLILAGLSDCGWQGQGLEPNPQMAYYACQNLGLAVEVNSLEQFHTTQSYDLISMIQVIGHFFDLRRALQVASQYTKPQGFWLIETSNQQSWTAKILGPNWHMYSPPSVLHWFNRDTLSKTVAEFGFQPVAWGRPTKWIGAAHAKAVLRYKLQANLVGRVMSEPLRLIPDRWTLPYPAEDLCWGLFQKKG